MHRPRTDLMKTLHKRIAALVIVGFLGVGLSCAQTQPSASSGNWLVDVWRTDEGLPHNSISSLAQTPDGYLWAGTFDSGLARFNGTHFEVLTPANTPQLTAMRFHQLLVDRDGTLWVGLMDGSLVSVRAGRFQFELAGEHMPGDWLMRLVLDRSDVKYFSTFDGTLLRCHESALGTNRWQRIHVPDHNFLTRFAADGAGRIWCITGSGVLYQLEGDVFLRLADLATADCGSVRELAADASGQIWAGTQRGLARWNGHAFELVAGAADDDAGAVEQLLPVADGSVWVRFHSQLRKWRAGQWISKALPWKKFAERPSLPVLMDDGAGGLWCANSGDGLWHVSGDGSVERLSKRDGLPNLLITQMIRDFEGNVWLGLEDGGLVRLRPRFIQAFDMDGPEDERGVSSVCEDDQGVIWLGGVRHALWRVNNGQCEAVHLPAAPGAMNTVVAPTAGRGVWVGSSLGGLWRQTSDGIQPSLDAKAFSTCEVVRVLYEDRSGRLWLGNEQGLWLLENGKLRSFSSEHGYNRVKMNPLLGNVADRYDPPFAEALTEDADGSIWVGLAQGELRRFRAGRFEAFRPKWAETWMRFWALSSDKEGGLWIGALGGGLIHFKDGMFWRFTERDGLPDDNVSQILDDGRGYLWLGTRKGIIRISKAELHDFFAERTKSVNCLTFGRGDGLPALQCSSGAQPSCWRGRDGRLWFTTTAGAVVIDAAKLRTNPLPPPVFVETVLVDGVSLDTVGSGQIGQGLIIPPGKHHVEFRFAGLSLSAPDKVRFRWRLKGADDQWKDGGKNHTASYSLLPPGDYTFQVIACNNDGVWNEKGYILPFRIQPYFWQNWWFKLPATALGLLGLAGVLLSVSHRRHQRQLEKIQHEEAIARERLEHQQALGAERARIARDLHDELGANLTSIGLLADLGRKRKEHVAEVDAGFANVAATARESVREMDAIVWTLNPRNDSLDRFANFIAHYAQDFFRPTAIFCELEIPASLPSLPMSAEARHCLFLATKEALNNITRHAAATVVKLRLECDAHKVVLTIADDGKGLPAQSPTNGQDGLANLRERLTTLGGELVIESQAGSGTCLRLIVPQDSIRQR